MLPFTQAQFLDTFRQYHEGVKVGQSLIMMVGVSGLSFTFWDHRVASRVVSACMAILWLWIGVVYFGIYFSRLSPSAPAFAAAFVIQAGVFAWAGFSDSVRYRWAPDLRGWLGALIVVYALAVYPALAFPQRQYYPSAPSFGVPGPSVIFTLGMLLWSNATWRLWLIPVIAALIGTGAAALLGMPQDYALAVAALVVVALPKRLN